MLKSYKIMLAAGAALALAGSVIGAPSWLDTGTTFSLEATASRMTGNGSDLFYLNSATAGTTKPLYRIDLATTTGSEMVYGLTPDITTLANGWQGIFFSKDKSSLYVAGDGAAATPATDSNALVKLDATTFAPDATFGTNGVYCAYARRGGTTILSDGRIIQFGLGHSAGDHTPRYDVVAADGSAATTFIWGDCTTGAEFTVDGQVVDGVFRSAVTDFGATAADDVIYAEKGGSVLKMTATGGDWTVTPTLSLVYLESPAAGATWQVGQQLTLDKEANQLIVGNQKDPYLRVIDLATYEVESYPVISGTGAANDGFLFATGIANNADGKKRLYVSGNFYNNHRAFVYKPVGTLAVTAPAGAQYSIDDGVTWVDAATTTVVDAGESITVKFSEVSGVTAPDQVVTVAQGKWEVVTPAYAAVFGVILTPDTAKWSLDGGVTWLDSGTTQACTMGDALNVTYSPVVGYFTPDPEVVNIDAAVVVRNVAYAQPVITATAGAGGAIAPAGAVTVAVGDSQTFTITPNTYYNIADVLVDGVSVGAVATYEFTNVDANHTIDASFAKQLAGSLTVTLEGAVADGRWSIDGGVTWYASGYTLSGFDAGQYLLEFLPVSGYKIPAPQQIAAAEGAVLTATGAYTAVSAFESWVPWKTYTIPVTLMPTPPATVAERIMVDVDGNVYIGGYGNSSTGGYMRSAAVYKYPFNNGAAPESLEVLAQADCGVYPPQWTTGGTQGYIGLAPDPAGGAYLHCDNGLCWSVKVNADGTTNTAFGPNGDGTRDFGANRYQCNASTADGESYVLGALWGGSFLVLDKNGANDIIATASVKGPVRNMTSSGNDVFFTLGAYTQIDKTYLDPVTSQVVTSKLALAPTTAGNMSGICYVPTDNTVACIGMVSRALEIFDGDSGQRLQNLSVTPQLSAGYNDVAYYSTPTKGEYLIALKHSVPAGYESVLIFKRGVTFTVDMGNAPAGAAWSLDGGQTWNTGTTATAAQLEDQTITFKEVAGYITPDPVTVASPETSYVLPDDSYVQLVADVTVTLTPDEVNPKGGWMLVQGAPEPGGITQWNASGYTETAVPYGQYTVTFRDVPGYNKPDDMLCSVTSTTAIQLTGVYKKVGLLTVTIIGADATARWSVDDWATSHVSGASLKLEAGDYTVKFNEVSGWTAPADVAVTIAGKDDAKSVLGEYIAQVGTISVSIDPADAVADGAAWSIDAGATWNNSGASVDVAPGPYTIVFKPLDELRWATPASQGVTVTSGVTTTATGIYSRFAGIFTYELF